MSSNSRGGNTRMSGLPKVPRSSGGFKVRNSSIGVVPRPGRPSLNRQSNIYSSKGSQPRQDPRPINDKSFQKECMLTLIGYVTSHGYSAPISTKLPSSKEIKDIIYFLLRQIDPDIHLGKLEDEVPMFFRWTNYPFQISKSALYAAGSPHCWPGLLAALSWLVELLQYEEMASEVKQSMEDSVLCDYISQAYVYFLQGNDDECRKLDEEFKQQIENEDEQLALAEAELEEEVEKLKTKIQKLTPEHSPLSILQGRKADYLTDVTKFTSIISTCQTHKEAVQKKIEEKKQETENLKAEIVKHSEENEALKERVGAQEINVAGVEKMDKESQILDSNTHALEMRAQDLDKEAWESEVLCANMLREMEICATTYNIACTRLKRVTCGEDEGQGIQYELKLNPREDKAEDILGRDVKGEVKPAVKSVMESSEKAIREAREEEIVIQKKLYAYEERHQEELDKEAALRAQNKKIDAQNKSKKDKIDKFIRSKAAERTTRESAVMENGNILKSRERECSETAKKCLIEYEETLKRCADEMKNVQNQVLEDFEVYIENKDYIESALRKVEAATGQILAMVESWRA